jgi:hypothetical protein
MYIKASCIFEEWISNTELHWTTLSYIELSTFFKKMMSAQFEMLFQNQLSFPFGPQKLSGVYSCREPG